MKSSILLPAFMLFCFFAFSQDNVASLLLPQPVSVTQGKGHFALNNKTIIQVLSADPSALRVGNFLSKKLSAVTGFSIAVITGTTIHGAKNNIELSLVHDASLGD